MILVVNADDAGADRARNDGILEAAERGVVRSASVLVGLGAAEDFLDRAGRIEGLGVGLHANFTEGRPLVEGHRSLTGPDGLFAGKREVLRRGALGLLDPREALRELAAQWERLWTLAVELGIEPSHLDGHNHAHLFPGIAEVLPGAIPEGLWVRRPPPALLADSERESILAGDPFAHGALARLLGDFSARAAGSGWSRFRSADRFEGLSLASGYGAEDLVRLLASSPAASGEVVELMTHPGRMDPASTVPFSRMEERRREVEALTSPILLRFIAEAGIRLSSFGRIP